MLVARYKGKRYHCEVTDGEDGKLVYTVGKRTFKSPSAAGVSIAKYAINGWVFWTEEDAFDAAEAAKKAAKAAA